MNRSISEITTRTNADAESDDRFERLIAAVESQTNALARLVQLMEGKNKKRTQSASHKLRRSVAERPLTVTPMVQAAVRRALAKART